MFRVPQPEEGSDLLSGVPVVALSDPPDEVAHWLKATFVPGSFPTCLDVVDWEQLLAVLRLSHKYHVPYFRRRALEHLAKYFPIDFDQVQENIVDIVELPRLGVTCTAIAESRLS
ncbi:uncharacterized protein SCHCODRAFT_02630169 [Schizophyllum commune H4-8]|nr:uncharacterized protein SCHCODRAFT_02630169 [Schizophyllum commune H4-8]KAI5891839.1 hypothetical protein SCHCODRAFT_02630169 [Schizophyllum commune H4-8]